MSNIIKWRANRHDFVRDKYRTSADRHKLDEKEEKELLTYKNISKKFEYCDWFGSSTNITATIKEVIKDKYGYFVFVIELSGSIPNHYAPLPSQILKERGLLFPIACSQIK